MIGLAVDSQMIYWVSSEGTTSSKCKVREIISGSKIGVGCTDNMVFFVHQGELIAQMEARFKLSELIPLSRGLTEIKGSGTKQHC